MHNSRTWTGIILVSAGTLLLALLLVWIFFHTEIESAYHKIFPWARETETTTNWSRPSIQAPMPTGSSELSDFYASTPRTRKTKDTEGKLNDGSHIDSSLWMSEYQTNATGISWRKDSNTVDILVETKLGERNFVVFPFQTDNKLSSKANVKQNIESQESKEKDTVNQEITDLSGESASDTILPIEPSGNSLSSPQTNGLLSLRVAFWQSPVNFKGYRLKKQSLILFGVSPDDSLRFERHPEGIVMKHGADSYLLHDKLDFESLEQARFLPIDSLLTTDSQETRTESIIHEN